MNDKIVPLFEEYNSKSLIIVDVQEPFSKWWIKNGKDDLVNDINDYCLNFSKVYQIWDDHEAGSPSYEFNNQIQSLQKHYGVDHADGEIENLEVHFSGETLKEVRHILASEIIEPKMYKTVNGNYAVLVNGSHKWFFPTEELVQALNNISGEIVLVGGAEGECLYDIEVLLRLLDKKFSVNRSFTYNANSVG